MKLCKIAAAVMAVTVSTAALAAIDEEQMAAFEADCRKYAQEDGVAADQLEEYLASCMQDLAAAQSEAAPEAGSGKE